MRFLRGLLVLVLLVVAVITLAGVSYREDSAIPPDLAGSRVEVAGIPLRVLQQGKGPDVLLIHGSPGSIEDWELIRRSLVRDHRVTLFDRPNSGFSGETGDSSFEHNADVALAVIDAMGLDDVTVVGHSYGGATALAMALRAPGKVKSFVILDSAAYTPSREPIFLFRLLMLPGFGTGLARLFGGELAAPRIVDGIIREFRHKRPSREFLDLRVRLWSTPKVTRSIAAETLGSPDFLNAQNTRYAGIRHPVRIVAQAEDAFRRGTAERLHAEIRGSTLRLLEGTGHFVQFEKPRKVRKEIRAASAAS